MSSHFLTPEDARKIVDLITVPAVYYPDKGAQCRLCGAWVRPVSVKKTVRYHHCHRCRLNFRSIRNDA